MHERIHHHYPQWLFAAVDVIVCQDGESMGSTAGPECPK
jgi:hypothetical protein